MQPSIFLSHGAPTLALSASAAASFLATLPDLLPERPSAVLVASAHWETPRPSLSSTPRNTTIHDFGGFPAPLYELRYDAPGAPALADRASGLLREAGLSPELDRERGLDHGAWVPLRRAWPAADLPVLQLSLQTALGPEHHLRLGQALAPLRREGVLILGSGGLTHNLGAFRGQAEDAPEPDWVSAFADWTSAALLEGRTEDLLAYRRLAPEAAHNHPSAEHVLPLFVALGAGGDGPARRLHRSTTYGILRMDAFAFGAADIPLWGDEAGESPPMGGSNGERPFDVARSSPPAGLRPTGPPRRGDICEA
jgi:4,5-DOPA dioxygenase extradiol